MRFEVPQFIDIEDKIFGPFSWKQFLYLGGGIGIGVATFLMSIWLFIFVGLPIAALAGALAFLPINNRPFSFFLEAIFHYLFQQRLYLWRQQSSIVHKGAAKEQDSTTSKSLIAPTPAEKASQERTDVTSLARKLELEALQKAE